jgi:hypothetical protein
MHNRIYEYVFTAPYAKTNISASYVCASTEYPHKHQWYYPSSNLSLLNTCRQIHIKTSLFLFT